MQEQRAPHSWSHLSQNFHTHQGDFFFRKMIDGREVEATQAVVVSFVWLKTFVYSTNKFGAAHVLGAEKRIVQKVLKMGW